jgi:hypothetical protein
VDRDAHVERCPDELAAISKDKGKRKLMTFLIISAMFAVSLIAGCAFRGLEVRELTALKAVAEGIATLEADIKAKL